MNRVIRLFFYFIVILISVSTFSCKKDTVHTSLLTPTDQKYFFVYTIVNQGQYGYGTDSADIAGGSGKNEANLSIGITNNAGINAIWIDTTKNIRYYSSLNFTPPIQVGSYQISDSLIYRNGSFYSFWIQANDTQNYVLNSFTYSAKKVTLNITRLDSVNGVVQGNFSGTFFGGHQSLQLQQINGSFSLVRQY